MANLTRDDVLKLARLSKLKLTEDEISKFRAELGEILEYVNILSEVDVKDKKPTTQVTGLVNVMRDDKLVDYQADQQALLKNLPGRQGNYIKVRRVL
ncbi:Asp-tRNA(Asn)/Glu-tRNA(Gln) amidotransferase subunit GatC [Candidatus Saccharibacteria bacterium]|nr:Asp-tRNA(Asn)/Glu-tRNA(Gln) amidotransferase subunit GatC [Candidatus Saccharibacteria bacterium]